MKQFAILAALTLMVSGCSKIPGTEAHMVRAAKDAAAATLRDPSSAQFRDVKVFKRPMHDPASGKDRPTAFVCGELNGKNVYGAYAGFSRFIYSTDSKETMSDPQTRYTQDEAEAEAERCRREAKGPHYHLASLELAKMICQRSMEMSEERLLQSRFEVVWSAGCETASS